MDDDGAEMNTSPQIDGLIHLYILEESSCDRSTPTVYSIFFRFCKDFNEMQGLNF